MEVASEWAMFLFQMKLSHQGGGSWKINPQFGKTWIQHKLKWSSQSALLWAGKKASLLYSVAEVGPSLCLASPKLRPTFPESSLESWSVKQVKSLKLWISSPNQVPSWPEAACTYLPHLIYLSSLFNIYKQNLVKTFHVSNRLQSQSFIQN